MNRIANLVLANVDGFLEDIPVDDLIAWRSGERSIVVIELPHWVYEVDRNQVRDGQVPAEVGCASSCEQVYVVFTN